MPPVDPLLVSQLESNIEFLKHKHPSEVGEARFNLKRAKLGKSIILDRRQEDATQKMD